MFKKLLAVILSVSMAVSVLTIVSPVTVSAASARYMEYLDRGLVAMQTDSGIYLSWRLLGTENYNTSFNVYRNNTLIATVSDSTNYLDKSGWASASYKVAPTSGSACEAVTAFSSGSNYIDIPLAPLDNYVAPDGTSYAYAAMDGSVGDLDGDGAYEIVVKREANRQHAGAAGFNHMYLEAYELDGTLIWRINMGQNMRAMTEFSFLVYDFNKDGLAEIICKTAPGTADATGRYVTAVSQSSTIKNADNTADYHDANGYILTGPEYLTLFNGKTGAAMDTIVYPILRGTNSANDLNYIWGDNYGHRAEKCMSVVAYLDGVNPSAVLWRGIYYGKTGYGDGRTALAAVSVNSSNRLVVGNRFDTWSGQTGYTSGNEQYIGQGNHNMTVGDVDNDGCDEIISGALCIDNNMKALWCSFRGHGDALHLGDYDPTNNCLEYFSVHECGGTTSYGVTLDYGMTLYDASNGKELFHNGRHKDTGRGVLANLGIGGYFQIWGSGVFIGNGYNSFTESSVTPSSSNFRIFWDGDLYDELWDATNPASTYTPNIFDYNKSTGAMETIFLSSDTTTINGTKATPILQADIFGDWREEFVVPTTDGRSMRVYTTNIVTTNKLYTLMHDSMYRLAVAWQNQYYKQPPHIGYYVSDNYDSYDKRAVKPNITVVKANSSTSTSTTTFWSENFEGSTHKFSPITSGYSDYTYKVTDPSKTNALNSIVYGVGSRAGGDTGVQSSQIGGSAYDDITVEMDLKLDACMSGKGSAISLLGSACSTNYLSSSSEILTVSATANGNGYWSSITINGVDITSAAKVSNGTANGESAGTAYTSSGVIFNSLNRDTTGWLHLTAKPNFDTQTVQVTLTRVSTGATVYTGTLNFVDSASSLEYIYMAGGKYYGAVWADNISITGTGSSSGNNSSGSGSSGSTTTTGTDVTWNFGSSSFVNLGTLSSSVTADNLTINANSSKTVAVSTSGSYTVDGKSYSTMLALGGGGNSSYRSVQFNVTGPCTIKVVAKSSGSSTRYLAVYDGSSTLGTMAQTSSLAVSTFNYTGGADTLYLFSQGSGINLYEITVDYN